MANSPDSSKDHSLTFAKHSDRYYRSMLFRTILRLILIYIGPLVLLAAYFMLQYEAIVSESNRLHMKAVAESQANTLDLFLSERRLNLANLNDDQAFTSATTRTECEKYLANLQRSSDAFVDLGYFDSTGIQYAYAGPFQSLEKRDYSSEQWFQTLKSGAEYVITDVYLGFRNKPHFTIGVRSVGDAPFGISRATLDPQKIYEYISGTGRDREVATLIMNGTGKIQLAPASVGEPLTQAAFVPPREPAIDVRSDDINGHLLTYAYSWLKSTDWALIVQELSHGGSGFLSPFNQRLTGMTTLLVAIGLVIVYIRAKRTTELRRDSDSAKAQLGQAAKLASVGELAAGIAHEINNPLASINEEAGLIKDMLDPQFGRNLTPIEIRPYLDSIQESVFRCRDITRKLLGFVRKTEVELKEHDLHVLIGEVTDGILGNEIELANIKIIKNFDLAIPMLFTDGNQLEQVFLNIIKNAIDAMEGKSGNIWIKTGFEEGNVKIEISDSGRGMTPEQMEHIFMPFYTTKEVGKGTGLGLSVSYGIVKSLRGRIEVESNPGVGTTFTIKFPVDTRTGNS